MTESKLIKREIQIKDFFYKLIRIQRVIEYRHLDA